MVGDAEGEDWALDALTATSVSNTWLFSADRTRE